MDKAVPDPGGALQAGRITLIPGARRLLVDGAPARVGSRAFDLLQLLLSRPGEILGKRELLEAVWPESVVEENNLQVQVCALRKLLGPRTIVTVPGRGYALTVGAVDPGTGEHPPTPTATVPLLTPLRGREAELAALLRIASEHRLVTLCGPGGVGKTRLAQAAAASPARDFATTTVELSGLQGRAPASAALVRVLGLALPERTAARQVALALADRPRLLVLENAEHAGDSTSAFVQALLEEAPSARVLVTSQVPLHLRGEHVMRLAPLPVPAAEGEPDPCNPAMQLLADAVDALQPDMPLDSAAQRDAAAICRHLDGLPLALELAAARVPMLGLAGVRRLLAERFHLLVVGARGTSARQRSLQASLAWSWALLEPAEQAALRALAALPAAAFRLTAARRALAPAVADQWHAMEVLGALVDKSLVLAEGAGRASFRLLESTRLFVTECAATEPLSGFVHGDIPVRAAGRH